MKTVKAQYEHFGDRGMIRQMLQLLWNRKRSNGFLAMEFFFTFLVLYIVFATGLDAWQRFRLPSGFTIDNVLNITVSPPETGNPIAGKHIKQISNVLKGMDEVQSVGLIDWSLFENIKIGYSHEVNGKKTVVNHINLSDTCEKILSIEMIQGRWFSEEDESENVHPAVINQRLRNALFGDADPIGKIFAERRIVGVVSDFRIYGELDKPRHFIIDRYRLDESEIWAHVFLFKLKSPSTSDKEIRLLSTLHSIMPTCTFEITRAEYLHDEMLKTQAIPYILA
jgi:putative ABC transport system permease protein